MGGIASQVGVTGHLSQVIDIFARVVHLAPEVAEVDRPAVLPEQGVKSRCAVARVPCGLAPIVNPPGHPDWVARKRRELVDSALCPDDRPKLKDLAGASAGWLLGGILGYPGHLVLVVDSRSPTVVAAKRGQRSHFLYVVPP